MNFASKEQRPSQVKPPPQRESDGDLVQGMMQENPNPSVQRMLEQADEVNTSRVQRNTFGGQAANESNYTHPDKQVQRMRDQANDVQKMDGTEVQTKLKIGKVGDKYEIEADKMADYVMGNSKKRDNLRPGDFMNSLGTFAPKKSVRDEVSMEEFLQAVLYNEESAVKTDSSVQRQEDEEAIQTMAGGSGEVNVSLSTLQQQLAESKGGGGTLPRETEKEMEEAFDKDFSDVRIHTDPEAILMNKELNAKAFTNGSDIYFNKGQYNPTSEKGKHLLAHELTHTVQQGAVGRSMVQKAEDEGESVNPKPMTPIDIKHRLDLTDEWAKYLDALYAEGKRTFEVDVKIGEQFTGVIKLNKKKGTAEGESAKYELAQGNQKYLEVGGWSFLDPLREAGVSPILVLNKFGDDQVTTGFLSVKIGDKALIADVQGFIKGLNENLEKMQFLGLEPLNVEGLENKFEEGRLIFQISALTTVVDGYLEAGGGMGIIGDKFTFNINADIDVAGLAQGKFMVARGEDGKLSGSADISADIANVSANIHVEYLAGVVTIQGTGRMESEKFSGEITLLVTDETRSKEMMHAALGIESMDSEKAAAETSSVVKPKTGKNQVLAGWGEITANITPWLSGTAKVGIDSKGQVTIVGEITVPEDVELMEQRGIKHEIFNLEIRAGYGIPLVGQVFLFASIGMFMNAGFGPLLLKDVGFTGTYSTDPDVLQAFEVTGTLNLNAFAIIGLVAEAGVGLTILGHDLKAGVSLTAAAGIKAYAEATPTLEYKEQASPEGGKVGETRLKGHFEAAAQLFLQLTGALFYELDSPWWSPAPDGREEFPLGEVQYPIGDSMGIGADMDWLIGSDEAPELKFSPVEFDGDKFTADVMADPPPGKKGKSDAEKPGEWDDGTGGGSQGDKPGTKDGEGLPDTGKKKEDLKNLPDEERYMRALDEISKLEKANPKPTKSVVEAKAKKVKKKYNLDKIQVETRGDYAGIYVKHKKQDNKRHILEVPMMSEAERLKLLDVAVGDLVKASNKASGEEGTLDRTKAEELLAKWKTDHPVVDDANVVDGGKTWDYFIDLGDKENTEKGKAKAEKGEGNGELTGVNDEFDTKSGEHHKLYVKKTSGGLFQIIIESEPTIYQDFVNTHYSKIEAPTDELTTAKDDALVLARTIDGELAKLAGDDVTITDEIEKDLDKKYDALAALTIKLIDASSISPIPNQNIVFGGKIGGFGSSMSIKYLKSKTTGEESSNLPFTDYPVLMQRKNDAGKKYYRNGHLLNANLHGPNNWDNLTPLSTKGNAQHLAKIEKQLKGALPTDGKPEFKAFKYVVIPNYSRGINQALITLVENSEDDYIVANRATIIEIIKAERFVPVSLSAQSVEMENVGGEWVDKTSGDYNITENINNDIGNSPQEYKVTNEKIIKYPVNFRTASRQEFLDAGFGQKTVGALLEVRRSDSGEEIETKEELYAEVIKQIQGAGGRITLKTLNAKINL